MATFKEYIKMNQIDEILPFVRIEFYVDDNQINTDFIEITQVIQGSFPIRDIELLKQSLLNELDCSDLEFGQYYSAQMLYTKVKGLPDYYKMIPFPYTKLPFKKVYSNE